MYFPTSRLNLKLLNLGRIRHSRVLDEIFNIKVGLTKLSTEKEQLCIYVIFTVINTEVVKNVT